MLHQRLIPQNCFFSLSKLTVYLICIRYSLYKLYNVSIFFINYLFFFIFLYLKFFYLLFKHIKQKPRFCISLFKGFSPRISIPVFLTYISCIKIFLQQKIVIFYLCIYLFKSVVYYSLNLLIYIHRKNTFKYLFSVLCIFHYKLTKLSLCNHHYLSKLLIIKSNYALDFFICLLILSIKDFSIRQSKNDIRCNTAFSKIGRSFYDIDTFIFPMCIFKCKLHKCFLLILSILTSHHFCFSVTTAHLIVKSIHYSIKNSSLT